MILLPVRFWKFTKREPLAIRARHYGLIRDSCLLIRHLPAPPQPTLPFHDPPPKKQERVRSRFMTKRKRTVTPDPFSRTIRRTLGPLLLVLNDAAAHFEVGHHLEGVHDGGDAAPGALNELAGSFWAGCSWLGSGHSVSELRLKLSLVARLEAVIPFISLCLRRHTSTSSTCAAVTSR